MKCKHSISEENDRLGFREPIVVQGDLPKQSISVRVIRCGLCLCFHGAIFVVVFFILFIFFQYGLSVSVIFFSDFISQASSGKNLCLWIFLAFVYFFLFYVWVGTIQTKEKNAKQTGRKDVFCKTVLTVFLPSRTVLFVCVIRTGFLFLANLRNGRNH